MFYFIFLLVAFCSQSLADECKCGQSKSTRIIGGTVVAQNKYPWIALLRIRKDGGVSRCGGSIINERFILTAAHCLDDITSVSVAVGINDVPFSDKFVAAEDFVIHPNYIRLSKRNDIGLVKLAQPLTFSNTVQPICLPKENTDETGELVVAGWGTTESGSLSDTLLETTLNSYPFDDCNKVWKILDRNVQMCAVGENKDSCGGDSGGPLMKIIGGKTVVVGLVSFGKRPCGKTKSAVYTKVSSLLPWIRANIGNTRICN